MRMQGIASALYGADDNKLSIALVAGTTKEDIAVEEHRILTVDIDSVNGVRDGFHELLTSMAGLSMQMLEERCEKFDAVASPVVFGISDKFKNRNFIPNFRMAFRGLLSSKKNRELARTPPKSRAELLRAVWDEDDHFIRAVFEAYYQNAGHTTSGISIHFRKFSDIGLTDDGAPIRKLNTEEKDERLLQLKLAAEAGDPVALRELRSAAREYAHSMVTLMKMNDMGPGTRFFMTAPRKEPYISSPSFNFLQWFDLRDVAGRVLTSYVDPPHNVALVIPQDDPNPPFSSVCATYLADYMDAVSGNTVKTAIPLGRRSQS